MSGIIHTIGRIFNTVGTTADTATKLIGTVATSVDILDLYATNAKERTEASIHANMEDFYANLAAETALEISSREETIRIAINSSPELKASYDKNLTQLETKLAAIKAKYHPEA